uniref:Uncharacterized protein n=1 Tax=Borreliella burgdorferi TaxID=139 RepID=Q9ZIZ6_BORBG|nr:unknown [Borreliella burgdorferi N40]
MLYIAENSPLLPVFLSFVASPSIAVTNFSATVVARTFASSMNEFSDTLLPVSLSVKAAKFTLLSAASFLILFISSVMSLALRSNMIFVSPFNPHDMRATSKLSLSKFLKLKILKVF